MPTIQSAVQGLHPRHPLRRAVVARDNWAMAAARKLPMSDRAKFGDKWHVAREKAEIAGYTMGMIDRAMGLVEDDFATVPCTAPLDFPRVA